MNIKDIARIAKVSPSTVSKIVNGRDDAISDKTREKVLRLVRQYHYRPYSTQATHAKHWVIGVLLRSSISFDTTLDGILETAQAQGYSVIVFDGFNDEKQELKNINAVCGQDVDGIIWEPVNENSLKLKGHFDDNSIPVITIGPFGGDKTLLMPYEEAAYKLTGELIDRGHRKIGCLMIKGRRTKAFLDGFKRSLYEHDISYDDSLVYYDLDKSILTKIGSHGLTGFVSSHYRKALEFSRLMDSFHYKIPADVSLVSIKNDTNEIFNYPTNTNISTYTIKNAYFGSYICQKLIASMEQTEPQLSSLQQDFHLDNTESIAAPSQGTKRKILVVGDLSIDTYLSVPQLPSEGTTTISQTTSRRPGGNGINQAIGAAKLGHEVALIGNVGSDNESDYLFEAMNRSNIDTSGVRRTHDANTGKSYIFVSPDGDSMISVISGANATLNGRCIHDNERLFDNAAYCLIQSEIPADAMIAAADLANAHGAKVIFKLSSGSDLPNELLAKTDIIILNTYELDILQPGKATIRAKAQNLRTQGAKCVIVTQGADGCYLLDETTQRHYDAAPFQSVDTTGAGDAFVSALASYLLYGYELSEAVAIATYAAGFSTTRQGVIDSLIDRFTLDSFIERVQQENRQGKERENEKAA
ncbi:PfkB family carbohydrate kinase [Bifidobacterium sp. ESL0690]|uniref:PfkB family carbohydrate kinase n=1 Tax=Bifidobacterium sp. ESL0690 TaxID=2983214 RepID=UPI0023F72A0D|nr:PfkB family carbohydrate kinase [Bifidobacterium sp. ESL0690]WEV46327.1 PfkB family carbohydrate kinase [Bifidobacterium sp. ESL0690]